MSKQLRLGDIWGAADSLGVRLKCGARRAKAQRARLGKLLIHMGRIEEGVLCTLLATGYSFIDMSDVNLQREALEAIPMHR